MDQWRITNDVANPFARVQRSKRVLKNHLDVERKLFEFHWWQLRHVLSFIENRALAERENSGYHSAQGRLAAS